MAEHHGVMGDRDLDHLIDTNPSVGREHVKLRAARAAQRGLWPSAPELPALTETEVVTRARERLQETGAVFITGATGSGKSSVLSMLVTDAALDDYAPAAAGAATQGSGERRVLYCDGGAPRPECPCRSPGTYRGRQEACSTRSRMSRTSLRGVSTSARATLTWADTRTATATRCPVQAELFAAECGALARRIGGRGPHLQAASNGSSCVQSTSSNPSTSSLASRFEHRGTPSEVRDAPHEPGTDSALELSATQIGGDDRRVAAITVVTPVEDQIQPLEGVGRSLAVQPESGSTVNRALGTRAPFGRSGVRTLVTLALRMLSLDRSNDFVRNR